MAIANGEKRAKAGAAPGQAQGQGISLTLIVPGDSLKCLLLLKSEAYPIFLLLYPSSTALKWNSVN